MNINKKDNINYLQENVFWEAPKIVYCLTAKHGRANSDFFRFFAVDWDKRFVEITNRVHYVTGYPMRDCGQYYAIYTHRTNPQDIVMFLGVALGYPLDLERL
jgi:hypothetical protein